MFKKIKSKKFPFKKSKLLVYGYFVFWILYFIYFWSGAITFEEGNVLAGHVNIWGDWAAHFTMGSRMAHGKLLLQESPFLIEQGFSYPFAANLLSALLIKAGINFFTAFTLPSAFFSIFVISTLYYFYKKIFDSELKAVTAASLFLFNGGLGFIYYLQDIFESAKPWETIINPPRTYTNIEPLLYRWINVVDSMIIPQRAFGLGFPLTLLALTLVWSQFLQPKTKRGGKKAVEKKNGEIFLAALILGLMPIIHTHSFLAAFIILFTWFTTQTWIEKFQLKTLRKWILLGVGVSLIALPLLKIFFLQNIAHDFAKWFPGWYVQDFPEENWIWFWIKNWGLIPILATLGWGGLVVKKGKKSQTLAATFFPFFIIFILLNLFLFQPFIWDNTKLLVWASVGFSGLSAHFLISKAQKKKNKTWLKRILLGLLFFVSIFAGLIDVYRNLRFKLHRYQMYSAEEVQLATFVKNTTSSDSVWLTGDNHNHWLYNLTGRQPLLTFRGWLWTHGYDYHPVERDVFSIYKNPDVNLTTIKKYNLEYVVIGENEKKAWQANPQKFAQSKNFTLIKQTPHYLIYQRN